jgi:hypothetical protein
MPIKVSSNASDMMINFGLNNPKVNESIVLMAKS